jgi:hypothetical protein
LLTGVCLLITSPPNLYCLQALTAVAGHAEPG